MLPNDETSSGRTSRPKDRPVPGDAPTGRQPGERVLGSIDHNPTPADPPTPSRTTRKKTPRFDPGSPYADLKFGDHNGYMRATVKGHPVADSRGRLRLHRAVLFDAIGPGPHDCQWCEWPGLRWDVDQDDPSYLIVDHVDGDGYNNPRSNLVPAHKWCNDYRSIMVELGIPWSVFRDVAPADRPPLRVTYNGAPTKAALDLARAIPAEAPVPSAFEASLTAALAPRPPSGPRVVPDPPPPRRRWGRRGRQASSDEGAPINVVWSDVVDLDEPARGNVRLQPPPAELLERYPQLRTIDFGKFGR